MSSASLLIFYSVILVVSTLLGSWLPTRVRMTHTATQLSMSFVAGLMLGIALYHLLPHASAMLREHGGVDRAVWWLMLGLLFMFVLLRAFHFHQHGHKQEECQHDHGGPGHRINPLSWVGMALGLSIHTLIDGMALGAAIQSASHSGAAAGLAGFGVFLAIMLHKPLDAMSIATLMVVSKSRPRTRVMVNLMFALLCPLGAVLFFVGISHIGIGRELVIGAALAFSAGVFVCISLSDLLPEVQFHSHDRGKLTVALLLGIAVAYGIGFFEPGHHGGQHEGESHTEHRHQH